MGVGINDSSSNNNEKSESLGIAPNESKNKPVDDDILPTVSDIFPSSREVAAESKNDELRRIKAAPTHT